MAQAGDGTAAAAANSVARQRGEAQRRLLDRLAGRRASATGPVSRSSGPPVVSFGQERMWLLEQMGEPSPVSNVAFTVRLRGHLDQQALERSLQTLQQRHDVLRTVYRHKDGVIVPSVLPGPSPVRPQDLTGSDDPAGQARAFILAEANRPFSLDRDPPARWSLLKLADDEHILVILLHHIASDGWSEAILNRELSQLYAAFRAGRPCPLPELPLQYADFASWQRQRGAGPAATLSLAYWRERLDGAPDSLRLPFDRPPTAETPLTGAAIDHHLGRELASRAERLARRERCTSFMVLLSTFAVLMRYHCGQQDMVIGVPVAGRALPEVEQLIGYFVNTVPLRLDLSGDPSFATLLRRVRRTVLDSYPHQQVPLERVLHELRPARVIGRQRLVQVLFQVDNTPSEPLRLEGVETQLEQIFPHAMAFDLAVGFDPSDPRVRGVWAYRDGLFAGPTVHKLQKHYVQILEHCTTVPDTPISAIPVTDP
jgi:Condensation domain